MILPYCVYVLISKTDLKLYIGFTKNIRDRLTDHNSGVAKSMICPLILLNSKRDSY
jgi:predicted GIY-YIG superfamily endonuclease